MYYSTIACLDSEHPQNMARVKMVHIGDHIIQHSCSPTSKPTPNPSHNYASDHRCSSAWGRFGQGPTAVCCREALASGRVYSPLTGAWSLSLRRCCGAWCALLPPIEVDEGASRAASTHQVEEACHHHKRERLASSYQGSTAHVDLCLT